jgi:nucleoside-diphosphate-sugar epimerase
MKTALVLGGGGFIGGHLAKQLKKDGFWVRIVDIKEKHEYFNHDDICDEYISGDLKDINVVKQVILSPNQKINNRFIDSENFIEVVEGDSFDEVYQLAADMGGAGYIFTGENDANVMHNSAMINLNVVHECVKKEVKKVFYSSSACMYPEHNQLDPNNPNCEESSAYPANPDSEYGWEKLFSERLYFAYNRNYGIPIAVARFQNIFGPEGTWDGGKEKSPAAICRKVAKLPDAQGEIEIWGDGKQTRSFLYVDECIEATRRLMESNFQGPVNIGSEEMVTINELVNIVGNLANKSFTRKYKLDAPTGVRGRNSSNDLIREKLNWDFQMTLEEGLARTYKWISDQISPQVLNE